MVWNSIFMNEFLPEADRTFDKDYRFIFKRNQFKGLFTSSITDSYASFKVLLPFSLWIHWKTLVFFQWQSGNASPLFEFPFYLYFVFALIWIVYIGQTMDSIWIKDYWSNTQTMRKVSFAPEYPNTNTNIERPFFGGTRIIWQKKISQQKHLTRMSTSFWKMPFALVW